jgi:hypothetical protein
MFALLSKFKSRHLLLKKEFIAAETLARIVRQHFLKKRLVKPSGVGALS